MVSLCDGLAVCELTGEIVWLGARFTYFDRDGFAARESRQLQQQRVNRRLSEPRPLTVTASSQINIPVSQTSKQNKNLLSVQHLSIIGCVCPRVLVCESVCLSCSLLFFVLRLTPANCLPLCSAPTILLVLAYALVGCEVPEVMDESHSF